MSGSESGSGSVSISLALPSFRERLCGQARRVAAWVDAQIGIRDRDLPSYERARAELGDVPWRTFDKTERWFLPSIGTLAAEDAQAAEAAAPTPSVSPASLASWVIPKPRLPKRVALGIAGAVLLSILVAVLGSAAPAPVVIPAPPAPSPVAAPELVIPAVAVAQRPHKKARERSGKRRSAHAHRHAGGSTKA